MVFSFVSARLLQSELYGEIHYYLSIITLLSALMVFGIDNYLIKTLQFSNSKKEEMGKAYIFITIIGMAILPFYFRIASSYLDRLHGNNNLIFILFIISWVGALCSATYAFFQAINKYQIKILFSGVIPHILFLLVLLIHYLTDTIDIFTSFYLLYYLLFYGAIGIPLMICLFKLPKLLYDFNSLKSIFFMAMAWILYNLTNPIASIIIGETYESFKIVGIFSISNQLLSVSGLATSVISSISLPVYAKIAKTKNMNSLYNYYQSFVRITMYISIPFYSAFIVESENLLNWFGSSYTGHNLILILLTISMIIENITGPCGNVLLMGGLEKQNFIASIFKFLSFLFIVAVLIKFTPYAAPIAAIVSALISNVIKLWHANKFVGKNLFGKNIILVFIVLSIISCTAFFGLSFISNKIIWTATNIIVGMSLIICFIRFTPFKQDVKFFTKGKEELSNNV